MLHKLNEQNLLVCDHISGQTSISIESIEALVRKHSPKFIVLDGIYLVSTGIGRSAMWEQSHELFYAMKNLCNSTGVAMCVSTQANREAANMFEPPKASQVAFGDALIRAADVALSMGFDNGISFAIYLITYFAPVYPLTHRPRLIIL